VKNHGLLDFSASIAALERQMDAIPAIRGPSDYPDDPVGYARDILGIKTIWSAQEDILRSLLEPPYRVMVKAGHSVGKSFIAAVAVNWWYDSFDPGVVISTAPDHRAVVDILWREIRTQRLAAGLGGMMPSAPEMSTGPGHYAKGFTAATGDSFQGRHPARLLIVFDEAVGIDPVFWETTSTMFKPIPGHAWLAIFNPTKTSSQAFIEDHSTDRHDKPKWKQYTLDCLEHPNVKGKQEGDPILIPAAVDWAQVDSWVQQWCERIPVSEATPQDVEWPFGSGQWWKQGPSFLARCRGIWPSGGAWTVWNEIDWLEAVKRHGAMPDIAFLPEIGCDCASGGEDFTSIHVRWGNESFHHESSNVMQAPGVLEKLKGLATTWASHATSVRSISATPIKPKAIPIKIDDDGFGRACSQMLMADGWNVVPIGAGTKSISGLYPNKRSELWFQVSDRAAIGLIGLGRLDRAVLDRLRQQLLTVEYGLDAGGRRVVEEKRWTRERIGRSPDDADAMNLAYLEGYEFGTAKFVEQSGPKTDPWSAPDRGSSGRRKIFGA
jgi:hypothetical protein